MDLPTKPWGFWRADKRSAAYETKADPAVARMPGRARPVY
jgi:hypothetical protein